MITYPKFSIASRVAISSNATMLISGVSLGFVLLLIGNYPIHDGALRHTGELGILVVRHERGI